MPGTFVDEHVAVPVEDRPARRVDPERAHPVVVRRGEVLVAGQHLQRPEPEEEHREDGERDEAEHATRSASCGVSRYGSSTRGSRRQEPPRAGVAQPRSRTSWTRSTRSTGGKSRRAKP